MHEEPVGHAVPHAPQFIALVIVSTQTPPQLVWPVGHSQAPAAHESPAPQALPQLPQLPTLDIVFTHDPLQFSSPSAQLSEHTPIEQT